MLDAFHDGALAMDQTRRVAEHIAGCHECAARLAEIASVDQLIASRPEPSAPVSLRSGLYARMAAASARPTPDAPETLRPAERRVALLAPPVLARPSHRRRVSAVSAAASLVALAAVVAVVLLSAPRPHPVIGRHVAATPRFASSTSEPVSGQSRSVASLAAMPHFADWRAAYLGVDQRLHIVTADGAMDIAAPVPSALSAVWAKARLPGVTVSPDGHMMAAVLRVSADASGPVALLSLVDGSLTTVHVAARALYWSPASDRLAVNVGDARQPHLDVIHPDDGTVTDLTGQINGAPVSMVDVLGWSDAGHLAVIYSPPSVMVTSPVRAATPSPTADTLAASYSLGALDADSGELRQVASLPTGARSVYLTPNGAEALVAPSPFAPAEVILTASGAARALPAITQRLAPMTAQTLSVKDTQTTVWSTADVWQPTSDDLAVSLAATDDGAPTLWLLDADNDLATPLGSHRTPLAWTPDGHTLLLTGSPLSSADMTTSDSAQPALYALAPVGPGGEERLLTGKMALFVGLVRTE